MSEEKNTDQLDENPTTAEEVTTESAPESEGATVDAIQQELESLSQQLTEAKEDALRAQAESQNARRRAEQDVEKAHKFGQEKLVSDLLPVIDNLERAMDSMPADNEEFKAVIEGLELTLKSFADTLSRHNIVAVNPVGEPFDPQLHQAMTMVESPDAEPNTVLNVFQKGYTLHGRLVRPAMVVVSKEPS